MDKKIFEGLNLGINEINGVGVVVKNSSNEILTVFENNPNESTWKKQGQESIVFGKINKGEQSIDTAQREIYEETGLEIPKQNFDFTGKVNIYYSKSHGVEKINLDIFETNFEGNLSNITNNEIISSRFVNIQSLIEKWKNDKSSIRPITFEAIFTNIVSGTQNFAAKTIQNGEYNKEYIKELNKIIKNIEKILKTKK
ncbi:NUDIX hydrolase [Candidatus Vampirococcus lugosii]|uniref:NUDIX hydrolase n=1 Tax=Candidatus Vampirococcus lugosii TaxID=2789015 RepID=A0ABS5QJT5_9BACT|nr:NUDIX hydrolase [Candidatus Vampirococcus lugosii]MBS8121424.1 putative NUDIX hydrolase [Candidatus Vampirococcus lugosii]